MCDWLFCCGRFQGFWIFDQARFSSHRSNRNWVIRYTRRSCLGLGKLDIRTDVLPLDVFLSLLSSSFFLLSLSLLYRADTSKRWAAGGAVEKRPSRAHDTHTHVYWYIDRYIYIIHESGYNTRRTCPFRLLAYITSRVRFSLPREGACVCGWQCERNGEREREREIRVKHRASSHRTNSRAQASRRGLTVTAKPHEESTPRTLYCTSAIHFFDL